jgi:hypothetical protein
MARRGIVPSFMLVACFAAVGCNSLLGTDEGTKAPPKAAADAPDGSAPPNSDGNNETGNPDAGGDSLTVRNDSKPPCDPCAPELVVNTGGYPRNVRVSRDYVYWTDYAGVHRVARSSIPCTKADCVETLLEGTNGGESLAISDSLVCWANHTTFGCADPADTTKKHETSGASLGLVGSRMVLQDGKIYFVQGTQSYDTPSTLVTGDAAGIAAKTSGVGNISAADVIVHAFTLSATHIAWAEGDNGAVTKVKPFGGNPVSIAYPDSLKSSLDYVEDLALFDKYVYISPYHGQYVYRAPIDGSAEATQLVEVGTSGAIVVKSSGIYIAFGDHANGYAFGLGWTNLAGDSGKTLVSPDGSIEAIDVADDAIYYAENAVVGTGNAIKRIKFQ